MFRRRHPAASFLTAVIFLTLALTPALAKKKPPSHPINLNTATADQLEEVPGIGPATAQKILDTRKSYGAFKSVDDLLSIKGIGQKRLDKMRKYLTVETIHAKHHTAPASSGRRNSRHSANQIPAQINQPHLRPRQAKTKNPSASRILEA